MVEVDSRGLVDIDSDKIDVDDFVDKVQKGIISYPYRRYYLPPPDELFEKLKGETIKERVLPITENTIQTFGMELPDEIIVLYADGAGEALTDYYSEPQRARGTVQNGIYSRYQLWMTMTRELIIRCTTQFKRVNTYSLRVTLREMGSVKVRAEIESIPERLRGGIRLAPETNNFNNGLAMEIYKRYCPMGGTVLDPSAGWGDRQLGAAASGVVKAYIATDPNYHLYWAYRAMKDAHAGDMDVVILPIGSQELPLEEEESVDLVFTSPPYADLEIYSKSSSQSSSLFANFEVWMEGFMYPSLERTYYRLKKGGKYILHIRDIQGHNLVRPIHDKLISLGATYSGLIGMVTSSTIAPVWIWEKPQ